MREFQLRIVTVHGHVAPDVQAYARRKLADLVKLAPGPVLDARVRFERAPDPAVELPALVQATLDVNGRLVRAQATARHFREAVDLLEARLRDRLQHLAGHLRDRRRPAGSRRFPVSRSGSPG
ncbi:MAG TPA: HPF/RaiA family ribosome-associated protein [Actinomycetes bacterium]|jgi:ribosome-associated translation inhibitor RaiA|nr:HPF/RaiA family ribosome-associated protein [Actinomycetes bacterium]